MNQNTSDQTANFRISGTGRATTSFTAPIVDSIAGALGIGTNTATAITLGGATTTGTIAIGTAAASTLNIGTGAFAHTIAIGTDATTVQGLILGSTNTTSSTTLQAGSGNINLNAATVASNQATVGLFTTPTTINEFTAASAVNIGAANTVVTYGNGGAATLRSTTGALTITSAAASTFSTGAGILTVQGFGGTTLNTPNASGAITGNISVASGNVASGSFASGNIVVDVGSSTGTTGTITLGGTSASSLAIGRTGVITTLNGTAQIGSSAGSGAVVNNGSTVNTVYPMSNLLAGGWDTGGAAATIDKYTYISANQTTVGQTLTIPSPTASTTYGRLLYLTNVGTTSLSLLGATIGTGSTATLVWANTNGGASWTYAGADASGILNQNTADQTANFRITGTGRANTSITSPLLDSISGGLSIGTTTATGVTIGGAATTGVIGIGTAAASTLNIGTGAFAHTIAIGTDASTVQGLTIGSTNASSATTLQAGFAINLNSGTVATNQATVSLFNATATTVNEYAAATTINVGATNTVVTYGNGGAATLRSTIGALTITSAAAATFSTSAGALTVDSAAALNLGTSNATSVSIGKSTTTTINNGTLQIGASAGTGGVVNNGSTVNQSLALGNFATGGTLGTSTATVDIYTYISVAQITASQTLTIPSPTASTTYGRLLYLTNVGTTSLSLLGATIGTGSTATLVWANTNGGASWTYAGADASGILNQNTADQTANFRITGTGRANTSITTPLVDSITGGLNLGTTTATGVTIGGTTNTTGITLQGAAGVTITIGNVAGSGSLTNNGGTLNTTLTLGNFATGGSIGTAASTVDIYTSISVTQTTSGQTLTVPAPTVTTQYGRVIYLSNVGTTSFDYSGVRIPSGSTATLIWSNTSGAASWQFAGAGASSIENQNSLSQAADFRINGSGRADTSFLTPSLDVASAGTLSLGASTATGINIGNITNTSAINLRVTAAGTITLGNLLVVNNLTGIVQVGSGTSNSGTSVFALNNNNGTTTPTEVDGGMYYNNSTSQFLCGENGFWVNCGVPPRDHSYDLYDEFMSGNSGTLATGAYGIGSLNWYNSLIGSPGSLTYNNNAVGGNAPAATVDRPGIIDIQQTGTGNGTGQTMSLGLASMKLGTSLLDLKTAVNITGGNLTVLLGLHNETTLVTAPTTGVYWKEASNGLWQYCYVNGTLVETCANSAVTATAGSWARLEIVVVSTSEIDYYINGTKIAVTGITYNSTNKVSPAYTSWKSTGTPGTLDMYIDYFELLGTTTTAR